MPYGANPIAGAGLSWMLWITHKIDALRSILLLGQASENDIPPSKRQKAIYRLVAAPQGGTQKYTAFAYDSPR